MNFLNKILFLTLIFAINSYGQLGFCPGSKGEPIFNENFGNGTTYGPALPAGTTTYTYISGAANDGFYTLFYQSNLYSTWHYSLDHTPDATNGPNGKMLIVNANASTSGDFYKKTVTGLCVNTTFEFSAWLMNVYNPNSNFCGAGQIPINVRFEIWNQNETVLLGSGNTGNIMGTPAPLWQQFALVFTTVNETAVVLKMKNNGLGGCGNDLAIDDISFSACGDLTTVSSPLATGSTYSTCTNPASIELFAATSGTSTYFYQWQTSIDGVNWNNIAGATGSSYTTPNISATTYFRVKTAQDIVNLNNPFCSTSSNMFTVSVLPSPNIAPSNGNVVICSGQAIPPLSVSPQPGVGVNWYNVPTGGTLLASGNSFTPTSPGIYYAESFSITTGCIAATRTPVELTIVPLPTAAISAPASVCGGDSATVNFSGTPNAQLTYTVDGGAAQNIALNASGTASLTTSSLTSNTTYTLVSATASASTNCINILNSSVTIAVNSLLTATISSDAAVCEGDSAVVLFNGTPNATITYTVDGGAGQTIVLDNSGTASVTALNITGTRVFTLVNISLNGGCVSTLSQSISINAILLPTATITASPINICPNQTSYIEFTGTPNAVVVFSVNGGPGQTIILDSSGVAGFTTLSGSFSPITYTLLSATLPNSNACSNILTDSVVLTFSNSATATISSNISTACIGSPATISFNGTPDAIVTYSVNNGSAQTITLNSSGSASLINPAISGTTTYTLINVTQAASGCTAALSQSLTISAVAFPTATISASLTSVCSNQPSVITISGTPGAEISFAVNGIGQTATLNSAGTASINTGPLLSDTTFQLTNAALAGNSCTQPLSDSVVITVNPTPTVTYNGDLGYCEGGVISLSLSSNIPGAIFNWVVTQSGTTGATPGSGSQIMQNVMLESTGPGTITYTVTPTFNGCQGLPVDIVVTINPLPVPEISDGAICLSNTNPTGQTYLLDTTLPASGHTFEWFFNGVLIPNASQSTFNASQIGTYTVIATNSAGCASIPVTAVVTETAQGESLVIEHSQAFSNGQTVIVTVTGGSGPYLYQIDNSGFQTSNVFSSVPSGTHTITVVDEYCTYLTESVTLIGYPTYFTPNGDGIHDTWNISGVDSDRILIFDRYGKLLKQIGTGDGGWDGTYNGQAMPSSDYWFSIDYSQNGSKKTFRAHFSIKR